MYPVEKLPNLDDLLGQFVERAHRMVWADLTTLDRLGRPRSRVVHPIWDGPVGWIGTRAGTPKVRQIQRNPHVSLAYVADIATPVYADCLATWVGDPAECQQVWELFKNAPEPLGYDPDTVFQGRDTAAFGMIRLVPYRLEVTNFPHGTRVWQSPDA